MFYEVGEERAANRGSAATYAPIFETFLLKVAAVIDVATVNHNITAHSLGDDTPRREAELLPFRHQHESVSVGHTVVHIDGILYGVTDAAATLVGCGRVVGHDFGAGLKEPFDNHERGGAAHIVGFRFERKAPDGNTFIPDIAESLDKQLIRTGLLSLVDSLNGLDDTHIVAILGTGMYQCLDVLGETGSAVTRAGIKEFRANTGISAYAFAHLGDVGTYKIA